MKKALIIYVVIFCLTIIIPTIVCLINQSNTAESTDELVTIFNQHISLIEYYR